MLGMHADLGHQRSRSAAVRDNRKGAEMSKSSEHMIQQAALQAKAKAAHALHHNPERDRMQPERRIVTERDRNANGR